MKDYELHCSFEISDGSPTATYLWLDVPAREEIAGYCNKSFNRVVQLVGSVRGKGGRQWAKSVGKVRRMTKGKDDKM